MLESLQNSWRIYTKKFEGVLLLSLSILFPLLLINWFVLNVVYLFVINEFTSALADFYYVFLTFIFLVLGQIPFIQFVKLYEEEGEVRYKNIYYVFITNAFSLFVFGICMSLITSIGVMLFIIPGFIALILLFSSPYEAILEERSVWKSVKTSVTFAKKKFFPLLFIVIFISLVEMVIAWASMYLIFSITSSLLSQVMVQMLLNLLIFPFLAIWVTYYFMGWKREYQFA